MDKLKLHTPDFTDANIAKVGELFPNCVTEAEDEDGAITKAIDFDLLRQELSSSIVEGPRNRYRLDWPGKPEAMLAANAPIAKTLRPCRDESVDFDTTKNLYIEGDNLDALKLLQETYLGKVKMIYIDPPYNTGNDFVYDDDFSETSAEYFERSNQADESRNRLVANTDANGRFHSDWLTMMYSRLKLARNLLADNGAIFISIDDNELHTLRGLCDEVFGSDNFVANVAWKHTQQSKNDEPYFSRNYNSLLIHRKSSATERFRLPRTAADNKHYSNPDSDPKGDWRSGDVRSPSPRPTLKYNIQTPTGKTISPPEKGWRWSEDEVKRKIASGEIIFNDDETRITRKIYLYRQEGRTPENVWADDSSGTTRQANAELNALFDGPPPFDTPKPTALLTKINQLFGAEKDYIVLDFFAGSATTAHAAMQLNAEDGGNRRHIMVQLPEPCDEKSAAFKAGYATIAEIGKERIRRAGAKIRADLEAQLEGELPESDKHREITAKLNNIDTGFRVLKVDSSNMADVYYMPDKVTQDGLDIQVENIKPDRTPEDLLFQVLLDWGVDLALPIEQETLDGKTVFFVDGNALAACFDPGLDEGFVKTLAKREPLRAVFRDASFATDATKINIEQIFKALSPHTELKAI